MAHYIAGARQVGSPFHAIEEIKTLIPGREIRQISGRAKILLILEGHCGFRTERGFCFDLKKGDVLVVHAPCTHFYTAPRGQVDAALHVFGFFLRPLKSWFARLSASDKGLALFLRDLLLADGHFEGVLDGSLVALINRFREEVHGDRLGGHGMQRALGLEIFLEMIRRMASPVAKRQVRHHGAIVSEVREFLEKVASEGKRQTLSEVAWKFRISEEHLARIFKRETGLSVMAFLRQVRVEAAKVLLVGSHVLPVAGVAQMLGFTSGQHFGKVFRRVTGQTPMAYRRSHANLFCNTPCPGTDK